MTNNESLTSLNRRLNGAQLRALTDNRRTLAGTTRSNTQSELTAASLRAEGLLTDDNTLTERAENLLELRALLS